MSSSREDPGTDRIAILSTRGRFWVAVLLLVLTLGGGVAARIATGSADSSPSPDPAASGGLQFSAGGTGPVSFRGRLDRASLLVGGDGLVNMELAIRGERQLSGVPVRLPTDLVVVLDRSGSMRGAPIEHALASVRALIDSLSDEDRFCLVSYASEATTTIPLSRATSLARREWLSTLERVRVAGGTNMASGIDLATAAVEGLRQAGRVPRVILLSDGHANEGDHSLQGLVGRAARAVAGEYVLSTVGVGSGFDEVLMTALADAGTGNFYYVRRSSELAGIFADEFASARENLASALEIEIQTEPGVEVLSAGGYPLERSPHRVSFRPGALFAGQERRIWVRLAVSAGEPVETPRADVPLGRFTLSYRSDSERRVLRFSEMPRVAFVKGERAYLATVDRKVWEQAVAEDELGELKQSVASAVRSGKREEALGRLQSFEARQRRLNHYLGSERVDEVIAGLEKMKAAVGAAFAAKSPAARNRLSKEYSAEGYDARRLGAKR